MPTNRHSEADLRELVTGTRVHATYGTSSRTVYDGDRYVRDDVVGNFPHANGFKLVRTHQHNPTMTGRFPASGSLVFEYDQLPMQAGPAFPASPFAAELSAFQLSGYRTEILARTNVGVPSANVPQNIAELGDFAGLVTQTKALWSDALRLVALGYISWRWVVSPLVSDLKALADFSKTVSGRIKTLESLRDRGFHRKRVFLARGYHRVTGSPEIVESQDFLLYGTPTTVSQSRVWGSVKWNLAPGVQLPPDQRGIADFSAMIDLGYTTYNGLRTLWELCPWSWFVDWFVKVGEFIDAHDGTVPCYSEDCCVMRMLTSTKTYSITGTPPGSITYDGTLVRQRHEKQRYVVSGPAFPNLGFPFLDLGKYAILSALSIVKEPSLAQLSKDRQDQIAAFLRRTFSARNRATVRNVRLTRSERSLIKDLMARDSAAEALRTRAWARRHSELR